MVVSPLEDRYKTEMNAYFDEENKIKRWADVEIALLKAHAKLGNVPKEAVPAAKKAREMLKASRVRQIEKEIRHDLMAVVRALDENCAGYGGYLHLGATSYDIEDTATALAFRDAITLIEKRVCLLRTQLRGLMKKYKSTVCIGRTHGQHAIPTTYGLKFAVYHEELGRDLERLAEAKRRISVGKMSGAVGTFASFEPFSFTERKALGEKKGIGATEKQGFKIQELVMEELGLKPASATNQVVQRDRHAEVMFALALVAAALEKMAKEFRNLQRTEILEICEGFSSKQVGSSTMPHKRNPHKSERICSLARVVRANVQTALENIPLEHERDLTNSANERYIFPESFITLDYMLVEMGKILENITLYDKNIKRNLELTKGLVTAERVMLALAGKIGRQKAHELVRKCSMKAFEEEKQLGEILSHDAEVKKHLTGAQVKELTNPYTYTGLAGEIIDNLLKL